MGWGDFSELVEPSLPCAWWSAYMHLFPPLLFTLLFVGSHVFLSFTANLCAHLLQKFCHKSGSLVFILHSSEMHRHLW